MMRIGLVGCVKMKARSAAPAGDLYISTLFRGRRAAVERGCDRWFILSALHGLIEPSRVLEPYDLALGDLNAADRRAWASRVLSSLGSALGDLGQHAFEIHAGAAYTDHGLVTGLRREGAEVLTPVRGLSFGEQLAWYVASQPAAAVNVGPRAQQGNDRRPPEAPRAQGRYAPLAAHLSSCSDVEVTLSFDEVAAILGKELPVSASRHRAWWSNGQHVQAEAWLSAGYAVAGVDLRARTVRFRRLP